MTIYKSAQRVQAGSRKTLTPTASAHMQQALATKPQTLDDLVTISGLAKPVVTRYINELYKADQKIVHVADWGEDARGYKTIRLFAWGGKPDCPKPLKWKSPAERMRAKRKENAS